MFGCTGLILFSDTGTIAVLNRQTQRDDAQNGTARSLMLWLWTNLTQHLLKSSIFFFVTSKSVSYECQLRSPIP